MTMFNTTNEAGETETGLKAFQAHIWLTVPVITKGCFEQELRHTQIDNSQNWARKHLEAIRFNYRKAPFSTIIFQKLNPSSTLITTI